MILSQDQTLVKKFLLASIAEELSFIGLLLFVAHSVRNVRINTWTYISSFQISTVFLRDPFRRGETSDYTEANFIVKCTLETF